VPLCRRVCILKVQPGGEEAKCCGADWCSLSMGKKSKTPGTDNNNHRLRCRSLVQWICVPSHKFCSLCDRHVDKFFSFVVSSFSSQLSRSPVAHRYTHT